MAALPEALDLTPLDGAAPSTATVQPTDFGLDQAAQQADQVAMMDRRNLRLQAQVDAQKARVAAQPYLQKFQEANSPAYAADAGAYTGAPGFAADQIAKTKDRADRFLSGDEVQALPPAVQSELQRGIEKYSGQVASTAIAHEASFAGEQAKAQVMATNDTQLAQAQSAYLQALAPLSAGLKQSYDPSQGGWLQASLANHDQAATIALSTAPAAIQPQMQEWLARQRLETTANGLSEEAAQHTAYLSTNAEKTIGATVDAVESDPTQFGKAAGVIQTAIGALPLDQNTRQKAMDENMARLVTARVRGLIAHGQAPQALQELNGPGKGQPGQYDTVLAPQLKESLLSEAEGAARSPQINSLQQAQQQLDIQRRAAGNLLALATTGQPAADAASIQEMAGAFGWDKAAEYQAQANAVRQQHQVTGDVHAMPGDALAMLANKPPPDPSDPNYAVDRQVWDTTRQAVQAEQTARASGAGSWLWNQPAPKGQKGKALGPYQASGADLQQSYQAVLQAGSPQAQAQAGQIYAGKMVAGLEAGGFSPQSWQMVSGPEAQRLANSVTMAPPENRQQALAAVATIVQAMPAQIRTSTGQIISPRNLLVTQLQQAKLSAPDATAIADFGTDQAKIARWAAASADPQAAKPLDKATEQSLVSAVQAQMRPWLQSLSPLPGNDALAQARIDRTMRTARWLVLTQGQGAKQAAESAAGDMSDGEVMVRGQRMPAALAGSVNWNPVTAWTGQSQGVGAPATDQVLKGQAKVVSDLLANNGAALYAPAATPGTPDQQRRQFALQVQAGSKWVTSADGQSSTLMVSTKSSGWQPVLDRYGRAISADWNTLQSQATPGAHALFANPPPSAPRTATGQPVAAASTTAAFPLFMQAIKGQESGGRNGLVSPAGAMGVYQVMPETAKPYAARLFGAPLDLNKLQNDPDYNRKIATAIAADALKQNNNDPVLAAVQYHSGRGALTGSVVNGVPHPGLLNTLGDPRTGAISHADFAARIPATMPELRKYVPGVASRFTALLHAYQQQ